MDRKHYPKYAQATKVVKRFGGVAVLAAAMGWNRATVYKWMMPRAAHPGGTDGLIPSRALLKLRDVARHEGVLLTDADMALTLTPPYPEDQD